MTNIKSKSTYEEDEEYIDVYDSGVELVEYVDDPEPYDDFDEYKDEKDRFDEEH